MKIFYLIVFTVSLLIGGCKKETPISQNFTKTVLSGVSQKGPFLNGSSLTIIDLDSNFFQTGKTFFTQITNNTGLYEIRNLSLSTQYALLKADGYYFNEIYNTNSNGPLTLYAISDLSDKSTVNVNLLSTIETARVMYLLGNGIPFANAKQQAQNEVLSMFFLQYNTMNTSELLNISQDGDDNAILLALSVILQGYRTEAGLSQLLAEISADMRTDGVLNNPELGSALINDAKLLDTVQIRSNLENKYSALGVTAVIPHFEKYIKLFLDSNTYTFTNFITFPENGSFGINILNTTDTVLPAGTNYSFCANLPEGTSLKVFYSNYMVIGYSISSSNGGWFDMSPPDRTFRSNRCGLIDMKVDLTSGLGSSTIYFYENNSTSPTRIKTLYVQ